MRLQEDFQRMIQRIAAGSGTSVQEVNQLLSQFKQMRKMMKRMGRGGLPQLFGT